MKTLSLNYYLNLKRNLCWSQFLVNIQNLCITLIMQWCFSTHHVNWGRRKIITSACLHRFSLRNMPTYTLTDIMHTVTRSYARRQAWRQAYTHTGFGFQCHHRLLDIHTHTRAHYLSFHDLREAPTRPRIVYERDTHTIPDTPTQHQLHRLPSYNGSDTGAADRLWNTVSILHPICRPWILKIFNVVAPSAEHRLKINHVSFKILLLIRSDCKAALLVSLMLRLLWLMLLFVCTDKKYSAEILRSCFLMIIFYLRLG